MHRASSSSAPRFVPALVAASLLGLPLAVAQDPAKPAPATPATAPGAQQPTPQTPPAAPAGDAPEIYSPEKDADLGEIIQGEIKKHVFIVGNRGKADLQIFRVNPTCGCTIAHVKTSDGVLHDPKTQVEGTTLCTLKPGETCEVQTDFNSTGQPPHKLEKTIVVISSDNKQPALQLTMHIDIQKVVSVEPNPVQFGEVTRGAASKQTTYIKLLKVEDVTITGFLDKPDYIEATWEKGTAPDGTPALKVDITLTDKAPTGYVTADLKAQTNNAKLATIPIQVYAQVRSEVTFDTGNSISKERLDFGVLTAGTEVTKEILIKNGNPAIPYVLKDVEVDSQYKSSLKVEMETIEAGVSYKVKVTTLKDLTARFFRGTLKFNADHPDLKGKTIDFNGWVKKPS